MRLKVHFKEETPLNAKFSCDNQIFHPIIGEIAALTGLNYNDLTHKPSINGVELVGNKTGEDLDLGSAVFPSGGVPGNILGINDNDEIAWLTPDSGTIDYDELINRPQINGITLSSNLSGNDLGLGTYSAPSGGIPASDMTAAVQLSLSKADTALQFDSVDSALSDNSENPVQNKVIKQALDDVTSMSIPSGGEAGQLLMKTSNVDYITEWVSPANEMEQDNTRPITAGAVYTTVGNIQQLLALI